MGPLLAIITAITQYLSTAADLPIIMVAGATIIVRAVAIITDAVIVIIIKL
jgi:hypothetical protein